MTVPVGLLLVGVWGLWSLRRGAKERPVAVLVAACLLFNLALFSLPGTRVYDGERLFLAAYPLLAVMIGLGLERLGTVPPIARWCSGAGHGARVGR